MSYLKNTVAAFAVALIVSVSVQGRESVESVLEKTGFSGGVAVQVGEDPQLLIELLEERPGMLGHLLVTSATQAEAARGLLVKQGVHGKITVSVRGVTQLPLVPDFVNLLIAEEGDVSREELLRVLAPAGTAMMGSEVIEKPRPDTMDDWTHYLYDASGNAVSKDKIKPPLVRVPWVGGPRWSRHHDTMSSVSACVSGDNKLFYIFDEGLTYSPYLPSRWTLIARDAFNGVVLWKQSISPWSGNLYRLKSGPANLPRRLVVQGKQIFVTLGMEKPVSVLDADTGEILKTLAGTEGTEEIIYDGGQLYLVVDRGADKPELASKRTGFQKSNWSVRQKDVLCYDLQNNRVAWRKTFDWVAPLTLCKSLGKIYFADGKVVIALNGNTGDVAWESEPVPIYGNSGGDLMATYYAPKLVVQNGVVMYSGGEDYVPHNGSIGKLYGLSAEMGETLWTATHPASGYQSPEDLFVVHGQAWCASTTAMRNMKADPLKQTGDVTAINVGSGKGGVQFGDVPAYWFHHRCHMAKSTEDYMLLSRTGIEFVDYKTGEWTLHHWVRGACLFGILPANNMVYAPQHPCSCYIGAKMFGFTALAPAVEDAALLTELPEAERLTIYRDSSATTVATGDQSTAANEWPTYRRDTERSGAAAGDLAMPTKKVWSVDLGGKLTQPVIAGGKVIVSNRDNPAVIAYDAHSGQEAWRFAPGAQVDSSPAVYKERVYFGCADGMIHCLNLADGVALWSYHAAPTEARHMFLERLESTHPVHGNVLVMNDRVYTVAGRSMFTDGGMRFLVLDALTGEKLIEKVMDDKVPGTDKELQMQHDILNMPMALSDLMSSDGEQVFMRYQPFDLEGNRGDLTFDESLYGYERELYTEHNDRALDKAFQIENQQGKNAHLFSQTGFLDDSWWHRTYWVYGTTPASGHSGYTRAGASGAPAGRAIAFDDSQIYTWGRMKKYFKWSEEYLYHLHAQDRESYEEKWSTVLPILVRSMIASDDRLYVAGPEELVRQDAIKPRVDDPSLTSVLAEQEDALLGKNGFTLLEVNKADGKILSGVKLDSVPQLDGMSGAYGNLYLVTVDGVLSCLGANGTAMDRLSDSEIATLNRLSAPPVSNAKGRRGN